jgi:hypothetical protein
VTRDEVLNVMKSLILLDGLKGWSCLSNEKMSEDGSWGATIQTDGPGKGVYVWVVPTGPRTSRISFALHVHGEAGSRCIQHLEFGEFPLEDVVAHVAAYFAFAAREKETKELFRPEGKRALKPPNDLAASMRSVIRNVELFPKVSVPFIALNDRTFTLNGPVSDAVHFLFEKWKDSPETRRMLALRGVRKELKGLIEAGGTLQDVETVWKEEIVANVMGK